MLALLMALVLPASPQEAPAPSKVQEGTLMTQVDLSVSRIEVKSLMHRGGLAASQDRLAVDQSTLAVREQRRIQGKDKPEAMPSVNDNQEESPNGNNFYRFCLEPGEKLKVQIQGKTEGRVFMRFVPPPVTDGMTPQYRIANLPPKPVRTKTIAIRNVLKTPTDVVLALYGPVNVPFELAIERSH